jgi:hypothetical protein
MSTDRPWLKVSLLAVLVLLLLFAASYSTFVYFGDLLINPIVYCIVQIVLIVRGRYAESKNVVQGGVVAAAATLLLLLFVNASQYANWQRLHQILVARIPLAVGLLTTLGTFLVDTRYKPRKFVVTIWSLLLATLTGFAVSFVLGMGLYFLYNHGYFVQWHYLTIAPPETGTLAASYQKGLYAKTIHNEYLLYTYDGWEIDQDQIDAERLHEMVKPCQLTGAPSSFLSRPPKNIVACVQFEGPVADGYYRYAYALDAEEAVWKWTSITYGMMGITFFIGIPLVGSIVGLAVESVILLMRRFKKPNDVEIQ